MSEEELKPSKTRRKKDMHALQDLGEALVALSAEKLEAVDISDSLRDAVIEAKRITKHEARRRQMQYIGRLMRDVEPGPIRAKLDEWEGKSSAATATLHRVERWRDRLIEDDAAFTAFADAFPGTDLQPLRACVREVRKERETQRPARHYRELFKLIRAAEEARGAHDVE
ncbi:MAG TPA: ribosome biogenesis factor YjgA [Burkholderiales bacterium]|nr:ribosome biogenesis factor YjgA [Burkholderiales bacterium]